MEQLGIVLSEGTTSDAKCQLLKSAERGRVYEGMLVIVERSSPKAKILARISEVIPFNDFYTQGDAWSESRRQGLDIPADVARKWEVCGLDLLRELASSQGSIAVPPRPGDRVLELDVETELNDIFDLDDVQQGIIWLGALRGYPAKIKLPLDVEQIPMHLAVFGVTGSGKSFTTGVLLEKLLDIPLRNGRIISYPLMIVDAHGDYVNYVEEYGLSDEKPEWAGAAPWFKRFVFPRSSVLAKSPEYVQSIGLNLDLLNAGDVANLLMDFYKGETSTAILQVTGLARVLDELESEGNSFTRILIDTEVLIDRIDSSRDIHTATKGAITRAVDNFRATIETNHALLSTSSQLKSPDFIDKLTEQRGVAILDFSADGAPGVDMPTKQLVMTYMAKVLFNRFSEYKRQDRKRYLLFMIEEAQNFCPSSTYSVGQSMSHSTLQAIATQGRKFGLSLCLISQRPAFVDKVIVSMCNSFLIHRVSPEDVNFVKKVTGGLPKSMAARLTNLGRGELIVHGQMTTIPFPMLIWIPESQRSVEHIAGTTRVVEGIAEASGIDVSEN